MPSFKDPSFQDRAAAAAKSKQAALDQLKNKARPDEERMAELRGAWDTQQQVLANERKVKSEAKTSAKATKAADKAADVARTEAAAELKAARLKPPTSEEMKAARDARYAARKARK